MSTKTTVIPTTAKAKKLSAQWLENRIALEELNEKQAAIESDLLAYGKHEGVESVGGVKWFSRTTVSGKLVPKSKSVNAKGALEELASDKKLAKPFIVSKFDQKACALACKEDSELAGKVGEYGLKAEVKQSIGYSFKNV